MSHYNSAYFEWQQKAGQLAGTGNLSFYSSFIREQDHVLDFGCGGGFLLSNISCAGKLGIEINEDARRRAAMNGIETVSSTEECPDEWADVIISCHALEHTSNPLNELKALYPKLKPKGKIIFMVPYERNVHYKPNDINQHLFTWSEMNLGNLFTLAGYRVIKVEELHHRFPPGSARIKNYLGNSTFQIASRIYGLIRRNITQVRIVATK